MRDVDRSSPIPCVSGQKISDDRERWRQDLNATLRGRSRCRENLLPGTSQDLHVFSPRASFYLWACLAVRGAGDLCHGFNTVQPLLATGIHPAPRDSPCLLGSSTFNAAVAIAIALYCTTSQYPHCSFQAPALLPQWHTVSRTPLPSLPCSITQSTRHSGDMVRPSQPYSGMYPVLFYRDFFFSRRK
jgi:hypothetical protein